MYAGVRDLRPVLDGAYMSRTLASLVATLLVVAALAPAAIGGATAADVTLSVTVVDSDGNHLGGITVNATWNDGAASATDTTLPNGEAGFAVPEGADVELQIEDDTYMRNFPYVVENVTEQSVEVPVSRSGTATVTVVDGGGRVSNAKVWLYKDGRYVDTKQTGQNGQSTTDALERGSYGLQVLKSGYYTNETDIDIDGDVTKTVRLRRGSVEAVFTVTDDHFDDPRPLENVTVNIQGRATLTTLPDGSATTTLPVNHDYTVTVTKDGYESVTETLPVSEKAASLDASIQREDALSIASDRAEVIVNNTVEVTVTDEYGEPVSEATVSVGGSTVGQTDAEGTFSVPIGSEGDVSISVEADGQSASVTVTGVKTGGETTPTATDAPTETPTETDSGTETPGESGPGFGVGVALAALAGALLAGRRR